MREAFGISTYFVEGTSFDADRKAKEDLAKSNALQRELVAQTETANKYSIVRTPPHATDSAEEQHSSEIVQMSDEYAYIHIRTSSGLSSN